MLEESSEDLQLYLREVTEEAQNEESCREDTASGGGQTGVTLQLCHLLLEGLY